MSQGGNSVESIYEKHIGSNMEMQYLPTPKANVLAAMEEYASIRAVAFAEWVRGNKYCIDTNNGKWYKRPIGPGSPSVANNTNELYTLFLQDNK
jgi:hypothetical protein